VPWSPLDGSAQAEAALGVVATLQAADSGRGTRPLARELTLLRVVSSQEEGLEAERYLEELAGRLAQEGLATGGPQACQRQVVQGAAAAAILAAAGAQALIATHGRSGLTRWALGSVADRVTAGGAAAVLLVRMGTRPALAPPPPTPVRDVDATRAVLQDARAKASPAPRGRARPPLGLPPHG
jgi:nucleotide-binding universal stress UspA family protein